MTNPTSQHYSNRNLSNAQATYNNRRGPAHTQRTHPPPYRESVSMWFNHRVCTSLYSDTAVKYNKNRNLLEIIIQK